MGHMTPDDKEIKHIRGIKGQSYQRNVNNAQNMREALCARNEKRSLENDECMDIKQFCNEITHHI